PAAITTALTQRQLTADGLRQHLAGHGQCGQPRLAREAARRAGGARSPRSARAALAALLLHDGADVASRLAVAQGAIAEAIDLELRHPLEGHQRARLAATQLKAADPVFFQL